MSGTDSTGNEKPETCDQALRSGLGSVLTAISELIGEKLSIRYVDIKHILIKDFIARMGGRDATTYGLLLRCAGINAGRILITIEPTLFQLLLRQKMVKDSKTGRHHGKEVDQMALGEVASLAGKYFIKGIANSLGKNLTSSYPVMVMDKVESIYDIAKSEVLESTEDIYDLNTNILLGNSAIDANIIAIVSPGLLSVTPESLLCAV
jgi:chemotaxis protein CheY-P-specific phosphatase CheC